MSINSVALSGNVTRDAEYRQSSSGTGILSFGLAVNERVKNRQTQQWESKPNFVDCVMFGARADALNGKITKGKKLFVSGRLSYSSWERDGQRRSKLEVVVEDLDFTSKGEGQARDDMTSGAQGYPQQYAQQGYQQPDAQYGQQGYQNGAYYQQYAPGVPF